MRFDKWLSGTSRCRNNMSTAKRCNTVHPQQQPLTCLRLPKRSAERDCPLPPSPDSRRITLTPMCLRRRLNACLPWTFCNMKHEIRHLCSLTNDRHVTHQMHAVLVWSPRSRVFVNNVAGAPPLEAVKPLARLSLFNPSTASFFFSVVVERCS